MNIYDDKYRKKHKISDEVWLHGDGIHTYIIIHLHHAVKNKALKAIQESSPKAAFDAMVARVGNEFDPSTNCYRIAQHMTEDDIRTRELEKKQRKDAIRKKRREYLASLYTLPQSYKSIPITLIRRDYTHYHAFRYTINGTNQNLWIPKKHCDEFGKIKDGQNLDYVFRSSTSQLEHAGITQAIPGIKRKNVCHLQEV